MAAGDLTLTYFGVYVDKRGVYSNYEYKFTTDQLPFRVRMASVWVSRPSGLNPDGVKLIIAVATSDQGRNIDLIEAPQRCHYHLTWNGDIRIDHALILECVTQGCAASDVFNYLVCVEEIERETPEKLPVRQPYIPVNPRWV